MKRVAEIKSGSVRQRTGGGGKKKLKRDGLKVHSYFITLISVKNKQARVTCFRRLVEGRMQVVFRCSGVTYVRLTSRCFRVAS